MPENPINTPNLATDVVAIDGIIVTQQDAATTVFNDLIKTCFQLKPTQDCETLILHDYTDYQELGVVELDDIIITISYGYKTDSGIEYICTGLAFAPNGQYVITGLDMDKCYVASVQIQYTTYDPTITVYNETVNVAYSKDCCSTSFDELAVTIKNKMRTLASSICKLVKIGRSVKVMKESYVKLSNLRWLYCNSTEPCADKEKVHCLYKKIK